MIGKNKSETKEKANVKLKVFCRNHSKCRQASFCGCRKKKLMRQAISLDDSLTTVLFFELQVQFCSFLVETIQQTKIS